MDLSQKRNGFTLPVVLIFVLAFLAAPLIFWLVSFRSREQATVRGASVQQMEKTGVYVQVTSELGSWGMFEYLCVSKEECIDSLTSGRKWEEISGGATSGSSTRIVYSDLWKDYKYLKLFVKPGWASTTHPFAFRGELGLEDSLSTSLDNIDTVIIPIAVIEKGDYSFLVFTDRF